MKTSIFIALTLMLATTVRGQVTTQGFLNLARTEAPGTLLSHPVTNGSEPIGRTTSINYLVQLSADLVDWHATGIDQHPTAPIGSTATASMTVTPGTEKIFLRLRVTNP